MSGDATIVGCPNEGLPGYTPGPLHRLVSCEACGGQCWIGPDQRRARAFKAAAGERVATWCFICVARHVRRPRTVALTDDSSGASVDVAAMIRGMKGWKP